MVRAIRTLQILLILLSYCSFSYAQSKPVSVSTIRAGIGQWLVGRRIGNYRYVEYPGYDGWYNNLNRPDLGAIDTPLLRRWPAAYEDGTYKPSGYDRPNPITLSEKLLKGDIGTKSVTGRNALLVFFGQQVVEEILDSQRAACPPEYFNIKIPDGHEYKEKHSEMPFLRTRFSFETGYSPNNPRQQLNEITPYIDGGLVYGTTKSWSDVLRTYRNGTFDKFGQLASSSNGLFPEINKVRLPMANPPPPFYHSDMVEQHELKKVERFFMLGNPRGNENPYLLTFGVLWFRWHNYLAQAIRNATTNWTNEQIYNEARKWLIATQQHIITEEWLPSWLGEPLPTYSGYDPSIDPQIDQFFQSAAFRFGHTLVTPGVYVMNLARDGCTEIKKIRTCNSFWRPQDFLSSEFEDDGVKKIIDIDHILKGMAHQLTEKEDHLIVEDLRGRVFGPLEFSRRDLMAVNIQRGRDHGLPDFNSARKAFGLLPITSFEHFQYTTPAYREELSRLYNGDVNKIDVWVGGIMETYLGPGELFRTIIKDQFKRIRDGDRYWYGNTANQLFTPEEINRIRNITLYDIIMAVTKFDEGDIPLNPFRVPRGNEVHENCVSLMSSSPCTNPQNSSENFTCRHLPPLNLNNLLDQELQCTKLETYDYFYFSEHSFIISFSVLFAVVVGFASLAFIMVKMREMEIIAEIDKMETKIITEISKNSKSHTAVEWESRKKSRIPVSVILNQELKQIQILNSSGQMRRVIDLKNSKNIEIYNAADEFHVMLRIENEYDLLLKFNAFFLRKAYIEDVELFLNKSNVAFSKKTVNMSTLFKTICTKKNRQERIEKFFKVVFKQAFKIQKDSEDTSNAKLSRDIVYTEITILEFAEALCMRPESEFVQKMFNLIDADKNGYVSFREFLDLLVIFSKGTADEKARIMFDMYDINGSGELTREDFIYMLKSLMETVNAKVDQTQLEDVVVNMLQKANLYNKNSLTFQDFLQLLASDKDKLDYAQLEFKGLSTKSKRMQEVQDTMDSIYADPQELRSRVEGNVPNNDNNEAPSTGLEVEVTTNVKPPQSKKLNSFIHIFSLYSYQMFWATMFTLVLLAIFAERAYYYTIEREHAGLRRIAGYGVTITRGAASAMMFCYSCLLVTMCKNLITYLRDTTLHLYIPFDSYISMHKYIAAWGLFFTLMHIVGHGFNFYHISTQTADDLTCLFRNYFHSTHELPKFHYWCWQTITGFTGVVATILAAVIYIFAISIVRKRLYNWFWNTHSLYPLFYIFIILHGAGRLIQPPFFHFFFLGPVILFALDRAYSLSRKKSQTPVLKSILLPSNVTMLELRRPDDFSYKSGQWIRIACTELGALEYHPFTLSSSPHEPTLTVHIRAVGHWTWNLRGLCDRGANDQLHVYIDGPFGEAHQDWDRSEVAVLIGAGIGITPFSSILKDLIYRAYIGQTFKCKKVYFLWITKTQRQFEWMVDVIREIEQKDQKGLVSAHLFITEFYQKFDLRTVLLYICERHFQRTANRSLFTGLRAVTHFGRPNFNKFFRSLQTIHPNVSKIDVFSCGTPPAIQQIDRVCININCNTERGPVFQHNFKSW